MKILYIPILFLFAYVSAQTVDMDRLERAAEGLDSSWVLTLIYKIQRDRLAQPDRDGRLTTDEVTRVRRAAFQAAGGSNRGIKQAELFFKSSAILTAVSGLTLFGQWIKNKLKNIKTPEQHVKKNNSNLFLKKLFCVSFCSTIFSYFYWAYRLKLEKHEAFINMCLDNASGTEWDTN